MKYLVLLLAVFIFYIVRSNAAVYQWAVEVEGVVSDETKAHPMAFLWVPENCDHVRALVFSQQNMCEETIFEHHAFRKAMTELGFAIIWISPGINQPWDVTSGCQKAFDKMLMDLGTISGYNELANAPVVPLGHSAMATFPWNFAAWNADRTLAVISYHGDAPRTNLTGYGRANLEWGRTRNIDGIPGLMIEGEYEWWEARVNPALAFRMMYPESCVSFLCDAGRGHFDVSDDVVDYMTLFLKKAAHYRLPADGAVGDSVRLQRLNPCHGWLAARWSATPAKRPKAAPFEGFKGDPHDAFWYFDEEMAVKTELFYARQYCKKMQYLGFVQNGSLLKYDAKVHAGTTGRFLPAVDGLTFYLNCAFTDSLRSKRTGEHAEGEVVISRICGPMVKVNDTTFKVQFYRMGMNNVRRTGDIWLVASNLGDKNYKSAVQQLNIRIPYRQMVGVEQHLVFYPISDTADYESDVELRAISDCGLPVAFYVKAGPAEVVDGNKIRFTGVPPRAKYPIKITVVAWQYGTDKIQTAEPVERSFFIRK